MIASERALAANGDDVVGLANRGPDRGAVDRRTGRESVDLDVVEVEHEMEDLVGVPVETHREDLLVSAADRTGDRGRTDCAGIVVQVSVGIAQGQLPGAPA